MPSFEHYFCGKIADDTISFRSLTVKNCRNESDLKTYCKKLISKEIKFETSPVENSVEERKRPAVYSVTKNRAHIIQQSISL